MSCRDCDGLCRQGRDCPHRMTWEDYKQSFQHIINSIRKWFGK